MIKCLSIVCALCVIGLVAAPAAAQSSSVGDKYVGIGTGVAVVDKSTWVVAGEAGYRVWKNLDAIVEGAGFGSVTSSAALNTTKPLVDYLAATQGKTATATVKMPAFYGSAGARWVFEDVKLWRMARPYGLVTIGAAHVKREPSFSLNGIDITSSLNQYGVTLGADLTQTQKPFASTVGAGVTMLYGRYYSDIGYRLTIMDTSPDTTKVNRFHVGFGVRF